MTGKTLIYTKIRCVNSSTKTFFDREFWLDLSTVSDAFRPRIEGIVKNDLSPAQFVELRPFLTLGDLESGFRSGRFDSYQGFAVPDYFEDEHGRPLDQISLVQILSGEEFPILPDNVGSVLRLGPTGMERQELWTVESANSLAHFFQLVEVIGAGDWLRGKLSISTPGDVRDRAGWINAFTCPDLGQMYSILLPIRQIYASDEAFNRACSVYLRHAKDPRKKWWIEQNKANFNHYLASIPQSHAIENLTVRKLLDLVMYGAGLVHYAKSDPELRRGFRELMARQHREQVIFVFIVYCRSLFTYAANAYHILRQDVEHWRTAEGAASPDLVFMAHLFQSHQLRTPEVT